MKSNPSKKKPANLDKLLAKEIEECRKAADAIENGRTMLAKFLGIRLSEVSRYFERGTRRPGGLILSGMRAFVRMQQIKPTKNGIFGRGHKLGRNVIILGDAQTTHVSKSADRKQRAAAGKLQATGSAAR